MNTGQETPVRERSSLRHSLFISEMLKHGDKEKAYKNVYPKAEGKALTSAANRLLALPEVAEAIAEATGRIRAEAEAEFRKRIEADIVDKLEFKQTLTRIIRCTYETEKTYRKHGGYETVPVKPSISNVLRALDMYGRMEGWFVKAKPETKKESKPEKPVWVPPPPEDTWPNNRKIYGPSRYDLYEEDTDYIWQYWDPNDSNTVEQFSAYLASRARRMGIESIPERELHKLPKDWQTCHKINPGKWDKIYYDLMELPKEQSKEDGEDNNLQQPGTMAKLQSVAPPSPLERAGERSFPAYQPPTYKYKDVTPPSPLERAGERSSPWVSLAKLINDSFDVYMHNNQQIKHWEDYLKIARLYYAKNFSAKKRAEVQKEAGWELNPEDFMQVRKKEA
jgi:hypothetical protein